MILIFLIIFLFSSQVSAQEKACCINKNKIKNQLISMVKKEQDARQNAIAAKNLDNPEIAKLISKIDQENTNNLKSILKKFEWITISEFGKEADNNAWLIVQHSPDLIFQKTILNILEKLYPIGETSASNFAYLYDRVSMYEKRPQRYGTQGNIKNGKWIVHEIENLKDLDKRRLEVGLSKFQEYVDQINKFYNLPG